MPYTELEYLSMKTPLAYQLSEYDCGTVAILNAIRYLYTRGEISPALIKHIGQCTMDTIDANGEHCKRGTSAAMIEYLASWINDNAENLGLDLKAELLKGDDAEIYNNQLEYCMKKGGVAILRVWDAVEHYVLCTKMDEKKAYIFDSYYVPEDDFDDDPETTMVHDKPFEYNRIVSKVRINAKNKREYALVRDDNKKILILYRKKK